MSELEYNKENRKDYFTYQKGDIEIKRTQCEFCKYNNKEDITKCIKYPEGKPLDVVNTKVRCKYIDVETQKN